MKLSSPTETTERQAEIPEQMEKLLGAVEFLENIVENVEISILNVLSDNSDTKEDAVTEINCSSELAREVQEFRQRVAQVNRRLDSLNSRIEL